MSLNGCLLVTGGTGSFGNAIVNGFLDSDLDEIRIFSRDEKKQDDMRQKYSHPKLSFHLGDVRSRDSIDRAMKGVDYVFHAAALKQVPSCEFYPLEAVQTNILGTENVLNSALSNNVSKVVCLSTDKAVYPINTMGLTKAIMEKCMVAASRYSLRNNLVLSCTRYGNVMASRGSVIPRFINQILSGEAITITNPSMTRFMMSLSDAVDLVLFAFSHSSNGDIFVQKAPATTVYNIAHSLLKIFDKTKHPINIIGTRHGEKLYESLLSNEEMVLAEDLGDYFRIPSDNRDLNYHKFTDLGLVDLSSSSESAEYNSSNTVQLSLDETTDLLLSLDIVKSHLYG